MSTYKGYTWLVDVPDDLVEPETGELQALRDRVAAQDRELEAKNKQIEQLPAEYPAPLVEVLGERLITLVDLVPERFLPGLFCLLQWPPLISYLFSSP